jgi:catalase
MSNKQRKNPSASAQALGTLAATVAAPADGADVGRPPKTSALAPIAAQRDAQAALAAGCPFPAAKAHEYAHGDDVPAPPTGQPQQPAHPLAGASTVSEAQPHNRWASAADGEPNALAAARLDGAGQALTTNQGVPVADNQHTLRAGVRGPALLEDFILREKLTHFDHERIPERVVHARGSAAHGYFECTLALDKLTLAAPLQQVGKRTPVFVRFSTVAGERGSADLARDVRGFAVKFYTEQGNWDIVGNNMPVFFIQDPMKFPDLVHAVKPEPHHGMPQAASAHDTFWDFVSLMPESTHMLMWAMSDRAIPRSLRTMQGFGVHTFRLVNAAGESMFCKFHWNPVAGTHSVSWDEAVKINGADSDFHRRDLWESIEAGVYPEWELGLQVFTEEQAEAFSFDVLDPTKLVPEELVPVHTVGRMVLNRNPDNFFAETEQVAFCTANVIPGIDFSNDPLLAGRHHSYLDTQLSRLGGPNFHELPINAARVPVANNSRDGMHRRGIARGRVAYEPNSLGGGCPFQAGMKGYMSFPTPVAGDKVRIKPKKFGEHYAQARLFWNSQTPVEQDHIVAAFRFELTRVQTQAIRERVVSMLRNVDEALATRLAQGLGLAALPPAMPLAVSEAPEPEVQRSPALSLTARPGQTGVRGLRVALLVADGCQAASLLRVQRQLLDAGAVPRFLGTQLGRVRCAGGELLPVESTFEASPSCLWDAAVLPDGGAAIEHLAANGLVLEFLKDAWRHGKTLRVLGAGHALMQAAGLPPAGADKEAQPGLIDDAACDADEGAFLEALAAVRHPLRGADPPPV